MGYVIYSNNGPVKRSAFKPSPKTCTACGSQFAPRNSMQRVCFSVSCAVTAAKSLTAKKAAREAKAIKKAGRERLMTRSDWVKKAQVAFNRYIRERDKDKPCISCGRSNDEVAGTGGWNPGGAWDCGHFLGVGAYPNLRYEPDNAHKQCKSCNGGSNHYAGKARTVASSYRGYLIKRIGLARVEALEADQTPRKYTIEELKELALHYRKLANA